MRKMFSIILCLAMVCTLLTGCSESFIEQFIEDLKQYDDVVLPTDREELEFDFYIICGEGTTDRSKEDVERYINAHLSDLYKTTLDIHYLSAEEYKDVVLTDAAKEGEEKADIVLVAGKDMFDSFYEENLLADISSLYSTKKFGLLNTMIASTLLESSVVSVPAVDQYGTTYMSSRYYTVPNNHVIGEYKYILIDKAEAQFFNYSNRQLEAMVTYDSTLELREKLGDKAADCVKEVSGIYTDKAKYEAEGYHVNVASYPLADVNDAFSSAFSIVRHELDTRHVESEDKIPKERKDIYNAYYDRCMEIVYALSADEVFKNLLQFGHRGTNYSVDDNGVVTPFTEGAGVYNMDILYTGNIFKSYYCEQINWNEAAYLNGIEQNKQSVTSNID